MEIESSWILQKMLDTDKKIIVSEGGARSGKTIANCEYVIIQCLKNPGMIVTIARWRAVWAKSTVRRDFDDTLQRYGLNNLVKINTTEMIYRFENGAEVQITGLDDPQRAHGRKNDMIWINEAMEVNYSSFKQLLIRNKGKALLDYNPSRTKHWIYDNILTRDDVLYIHSTPAQNPFLPEEMIKELQALKETNYNEYRVYYLGERSKPEDAIYKNYTLWENQEHFERDNQLTPLDTVYGIDFGWTNPTALIEVTEYEDNNFFVRTLIYENRLSNDGLIEKMNQLQIAGTDVIVADSAHPAIIEEIYNAGYNVHKYNKKKLLVNDGIRQVQNTKLHLRQDDFSLLTELENYQWKKDKAGELLESPNSGFDHLMDALRYAITGTTGGKFDIM